MKVIIITNHFESNVGYGRFSGDLIKYLKKNKCEVAVICNKSNNNIKDVAQFPVLPAALSFKKNFFLSWFYLLKLFKKRKELGSFDAIHCVVESYAFFAYILSKFLGVKYFVHIHGSFSILFFRYKIYGFLQKKAYKNARKIICISNYTKGKLLNYLKINNLKVVPNGVNLDIFKTNENKKNIAKENIILSVGSFKERKGFDLLIKSLIAVKEKISDIKCYLVGGSGEDSYFQFLVGLAEKSGVKDSVVFLRNIPDNQLMDLYLKAKVFVLTTVSDEFNFDGFGMVYLEANAFGLPVIGSYDSGAEEAIKDGYNGFLTKAGDTEDIAQKIISLITDNDLRRKLSENAIEWAKKLSWDNIAKEYIKTYQE